MNTNAQSQSYQAIEAETHTPTQPCQVIEMPLPRQGEAQGDAREVQPQERPNFPLNMRELAEAFGVSRQAITPKFKAIAKIYQEFGRGAEVESEGLCLEQGYEELVNYYQSPKPSLPKFEAQLRDRLAKETPKNPPSMAEIAGELTVTPVATLTEVSPVQSVDFGGTMTTLTSAIASMQRKQLAPNIQELLNLDASSMQTEQLLGTLAGTTRAAIRINAEESAYQQAMAENARLKQLLAQQSVNQIQGNNNE